jgi:hypothetical protein
MTTADRDLHFQVFHPELRRPGRAHWLTITRAGSFGFSAASWVAIGSPDRVALLWDENQRRFGLRAANDDETTYSVLRSGASARLVNARLFCSHYGIDHPRAIRREAHVQDGILLASLNDDGYIVSSNRSSK